MMDRSTGQPLSGWPSVVQSIATILTTPIGTRVMRREFGSELMDLVDRPMTPEVVLALYAATAYAVERWEPRFRLTGVEMSEPTAAGSITLVLRGEYEGELRDAAVSLGVAA